MQYVHKIAKMLSTDIVAVHEGIVWKLRVEVLQFVLAAA